MKNLLVFVLASFLSASSWAKVIQIIHTNDLHSYYVGTRNQLGGYARIKSLTDKLRSEATSRGIPTLHLDGGDFGEGTSFYLSDKGTDSIRALDLLGIDVVVLGNHDFLVSAKDLRRQILDSKLKATLLSANFRFKGLAGLKKHMPDYVDFNFEGKKLRIVGLTTSDYHFQYPLLPKNFIASPKKVFAKQERKAKKHGVDFLIALTHIGYSEDKDLAAKSSNLDLVVGGHSHTSLPKPVIVTNTIGKQIPIVQAGANTQHLGVMEIDLDTKKIVSYRYFDITRDISEDEKIKEFVEEAKVKRDQYLGRSWDETIGFSEIPLSGTFNGHVGSADTNTCWSRHLARIARLKTNADIGLQFDVFQGERIAAGEIRYGDIIDNYPHFRKFNDPGWQISKVSMQGYVLKKLIGSLAVADEKFKTSFDGLQVVGANRRIGNFTITKDDPENAFINGSPISNWKVYSVALPREIPYAFIRTIKFWSFLMFRHWSNWGWYYPAIESYIKENQPLRCIQD